MGIKYEVVSDQDIFNTSTGHKINYSHNNAISGTQIKPQGLLFETGLNEFDVESGSWNDVPTLFPNPETEVPFDLFSAVFYMVSRYEEYLPFKPDDHGRFQAEDSLAFRKGFLIRPVVDHWTNNLAILLMSKNPELKIELPSFKYISSIDIDSAFAYKQKGLMRTLGGISKDVLSADWQNLKDRLNVVFRGFHDPYDTYDELIEIHREHGIQAIFFVLLASYGHNDKNVPWSSRKFHQLIKKLNDYSLVGIHPGYVSNFEHEKLGAEIQRLQRIIHQDVTASRQHFLMLDLPGIYRRLINHGILSDYTMGFASQVGFRAGTSHWFPFYDLEKELITPLHIHPFAVMDATLSRYLNLNPDDALEVVKTIIDEVAALGGTFISLWHNESLSEQHHWVGWKKHYLDMLDYVSGKLNNGNES